jgi:hypothetical protein
VRIRHGRYILSSKEQIEATLEEQDEQIHLLRTQLELVRQFANHQLDLHQPYVHASDLDISCVEPSEMKAKLAEKLTRNIWCSRCSNPWPCAHIPALRLLRDLGRGWSNMSDLLALSDRISKLPVPKKREGQLEIGL